MTKINVLQFITPAGFYGAERWVLALANNIDTAGVNCDLAVTRESADQDLTVAELYPTDSGQQVHYLGMNGRFDLRVIKQLDRKSTRLNSSHVRISYAVFCLNKKKQPHLQSCSPRPLPSDNRGCARLRLRACNSL